VRVLVTAKDAPTLFDLRCLVREDLISWLHESSPVSIPRARVQMVADEPAVSGRPRRSTSEAGGLFSGENADSERTALFTSAIPVQSPDDGGRPDGRPVARPDR